MASIAILVNSINSKVFCRECPFNLGLTHLNAVFSDYYNKVPEEDEIKYQCTSRRCVLDREEPDEKYPFIYLCNYDPTEEFDFDARLRNSILMIHIKDNFRMGLKLLQIYN